MPVHEDIKRGAPGWEEKADAWAQSIRNLADCGITTVCYNFMPLLDWTRTDLTYALPDGALCLRYDAVDAAVFDIHILARDGAAEDHRPEIVTRAAERIAQMTAADCDALTRQSSPLSLAPKKALTSTVSARTSRFITALMPQGCAPILPLF